MSFFSNTLNISHVDKSLKPNYLTIFAFIWGCQALVHQEFFYFKWLPEVNILGWLLTAVVISVILFPSSLILFCFMLITSISYNIGLWPYVVNHILLETLIDLTILFAVILTYFQNRLNQINLNDFKNEIFKKIAPVLLFIVIVMYWFIVNSKTNVDFFNFDRSCIADFYIDLTDMLGFIGLPELNVGTDSTPALISLWIFMIIEVMIPLGLMFKKTRYLALVVGVPFHLLLALIGHRTFSGFILSLYVLICIDSVAIVLAIFRQKIGEKLLKKIIMIARVIVVSLALLFFILYLIESTALAYIFDYRIRLTVFLLYWGGVSTLIFIAISRYYKVKDSEPTEVWVMSPKWVWLMTIPLVINGFSPFLGFKTETSFAMYSNLKTERTEPGNHMFMPTFNLVSYQEDLVSILDTDHQQLHHWIQRVPLHDRDQVLRKLEIVFFEFNRVIAETMVKQPDMDFYVTYSRNGGEPITFRSSAPDAHLAEVAQLQPIVMRKLMYFRPVYAGKASYCQH